MGKTIFLKLSTIILSLLSRRGPMSCAPNYTVKQAQEKIRTVHTNFSHLIIVTIPNNECVTIFKNLPRTI
jgi:hypothetical protein